MDKFVKIFKKVLYIILFVLIICSALYIVKYYYDMYNSKKESHLLDDLPTNQIDENNVTNSTEELMYDANVIEKTDRMLKLENLQKENSDIIAWVEIPDTNINYPVLQGTDNDFYMNHNYKKNYTISGAIFLDKDYCWNPPSSNLLIYGHNMKNGTMFQNLLKYKSANFYNNHPNIRFTTNTEDSTFEIIAVFESKVYYKSQKDVFKYYYFINANNADEYNNYIQNIKSLSLYDTGKTAEYGDQLITLSTCAYHTKDGRFVVVGRKIE